VSGAAGVSMSQVTPEQARRTQRMKDLLGTKATPDVPRAEHQHQQQHQQQQQQQQHQPHESLEAPMEEVPAEPAAADGSAGAAPSASTGQQQQPQALNVPLPTPQQQQEQDAGSSIARRIIPALSRVQVGSAALHRRATHCPYWLRLCQCKLLPAVQVLWLCQKKFASTDAGLACWRSGAAVLLSCCTAANLTRSLDFTTPPDATKQRPLAYLHAVSSDRLEEPHIIQTNQ